MENIIVFFSQNQLLILFCVIGLGFLIGNLKIGGFSFGISAVLFVGIAFGAIDKRVDLPEYIYVIGLVLFVYAIGLQSGPGFFSSFKKRGLKANMLAVVLLCIGAIVTIVIWKLLKISAPSAVGLFCGALTNTPALAATVETIKTFSKDLPASVADLSSQSPVVTFGLAYPFGVLGVIFSFFIFSKILKIDFKKESKDVEGKEIISRTYKINNPALFGKNITEILDHIDNRKFALSRIKKKNKIFIVTPDTILEEGDLIVAIGNTDTLESAHILFGEEENDIVDISDKNTEEFSYSNIFVSNSEVAGHSIHQLNLERKFEATITRIRRGDVELVTTPNTIIEIGDRIRVVSRSENIEKVTRYFGDSMKALSDTDFLSLSLGIVLGVFLGMIPIPLPNGAVFKLGFAGGPLIVGLIAGRLERTGPITWGLPFNANLVLRHIGLVLFQAGIGIKAGHGFTATFETGGLSLILSGMLITLIVTISTILVANKILKLPMSAIMGMMSGMQTQPSCLAYSNQLAQNDLPNVWYATVYPSSMITKIILAQILISTLLLL